MKNKKKEQFCKENLSLSFHFRASVSVGKILPALAHFKKGRNGYAPASGIEFICKTIINSSIAQALVALFCSCLPCPKHTLQEQDGMGKSFIFF